MSIFWDGNCTMKLSHCSNPYCIYSLRNESQKKSEVISGPQLQPKVLFENKTAIPLT